MHLGVTKTLAIMEAAIMSLNSAERVRLQLRRLMRSFKALAWIALWSQFSKICGGTQMSNHTVPRVKSHKFA